MPGPSSGMPASGKTRAAHSGAQRGQRVSQQVRHMASGAVSSTLSMSVDRTDAADRMGHESANLAAKATATAVRGAREGVGKTAKTGRAIMNRNRRDAYKAKLKTARNAAKGKPVKVGDAKASGKIMKLKKAGRASLKVGKSIGTPAVRLGGKGMDAAGQIDSRLMQADTDEASRIGTASRDIAFKAGRSGVRGVTSSSKAMWRHRKAPVKAAKATVDGAKTAIRMIRVAAAMVRTAVTAIAGAIGSMGLPLIAILAAILAVVVMIASVFSFLFGGVQDSTTTSVDNVPAEYQSDVIRAGSVCEIVTPSIIAAQIEAESNWNPNAGSPAGAQGIAQFMPGTWASVGMDGDNDGKADVRNPHDAIWTQGNYMCRLASQVEGYKQQGRLAGDTLQLALAAYNAGIGSVLRAGMIPPYSETTNYVKKIMNLAQTKYTATGGTGGGTKAGTLNPKLTVSADGIVSTAGIDLSPGSTYAQGQCTWWAAIRRAQIGKPVDGHMGDGGDWAATARRLGYPVSNNPQPGDAICFGRGVLGADATYGHIAIVEEVHKDGSILISEANAKGVGVVSTRSITATQLKAVGNGVQYIH